MALKTSGGVAYEKPRQGDSGQVSQRSRISGSGRENSRLDAVSFSDPAAFNRVNEAGLHYTSIEHTLQRLGHNGGAIDIVNGARVTFENLKYDRSTDTVTGRVRIENWFEANLAYRNARDEKPPDRTLIFDINHILMREIPEHRSKHDPSKTRLTGKEVASILQEFADGLTVGVGQRVEDYRDSPIRSGQRIQRLVMPDIDNMRGLGLCARLTYISDDKDADYMKTAREFVSNANRAIAEGERLNPKEAGWRVRLVDGDIAGYVANNPTYTGKPTSRLHILDDIGLPIHKGWFKKTGENRKYYGEGMSKEAIDYYNSIADAKFYIQCFYGVKFEKYKLQGPSQGIRTELDKNGYEVKLGTANRTHPEYIRDTKPGFFKKWKDRILGFLFDGYGASFCRNIEFQKDEDINRFQIDAGKQRSGLSRIFTYKRNINYWNSAGLTGGNRTFFELLIGAHQNQNDTMANCYNKYLDLAQKFATEHLKANRKNLWMTSPFLRSVLAICNGNKPQQTMTGHQEPSIIILNLHFAKFKDVQFYNANFFNANLHGCKFRNIIINGGFTGSNFNYCDVGDPWYTRFLRKEWLRALHMPEWLVAWFGNKSLLGFGDEGDGGVTNGAENVVFRGSKIRKGTVFEGAIKSGEMRFSAFGFSRFSADIYEMAEFGIKVPPTIWPLRILRFWGFRYKEEIKDLDPQLKELAMNWGIFTALDEWHGRARQYSAKNHFYYLKQDMDRVYADGTSVEEDERLLWVEAMQWVPNGIGGRVHRLLMVGADAVGKSQNWGFVEILADDDSMKHHYLYGHYGQASSRIVDKVFSQQDAIRAPKRDNETFFRQFIRNRNRLGSPATRQRKGNPYVSPSSTAKTDNARDTSPSLTTAA